jgi:NAD(P)-dependent dehydrogenase (short-subunit alcohol dehydrogenase family)
VKEKDMGRVTGKVALVTGAASGIGAEVAGVLAAEGARVVLADINLDGAHTRAAQIRDAGDEAAAVALDLGDEASIAEMIAFTVRHFGALDVLHNNAADTRLSSTRDAPLEQLEPAVWDEIFRVNLRGTMLATKLALPRLRARGGGSIIMTSSGAGHAGAMSHTAYGVAKAALNMLVQYVATQHGKEGIRCNAIAPGLIVTPATADSYARSGVGDIMLAHHLTPRLGRPADIAAMALYLASDESSFVTGQVFNVDGGMFAHAPYTAELSRMPAR